MMQLFPAFQKLWKDGTETIQACDSCFTPGLCASIVIAFILGVDLFDYVTDGRYSLKMDGKSNP